MSIYLLICWHITLFYLIVIRCFHKNFQSPSKHISNSDGDRTALDRSGLRSSTGPPKYRTGNEKPVLVGPGPVQIAWIGLEWYCENPLGGAVLPCRVSVAPLVRNTGTVTSAAHYYVPQLPHVNCIVRKVKLDNLKFFNWIFSICFKMILLQALKNTVKYLDRGPDRGPDHLPLDRTRTGPPFHKTGPPPKSGPVSITNS